MRSLRDKPLRGKDKGAFPRPRAPSFQPCARTELQEGSASLHSGANDLDHIGVGESGDVPGVALGGDGEPMSADCHVMLLPALVGAVRELPLLFLLTSHSLVLATTDLLPSASRSGVARRR